MCTHNLCFEQNQEKIRIFHLKIGIFTALKYRCMFRRVIVMNEGDEVYRDR